MKIYSLMKGEDQPGDQVIFLSKSEAQDMYNIYVKYCADNPRMKKAKKVLKQFADELQIW